ncbi:hypothetical protein M413DRAFT_380244 [Hebeloma cylindrosporum]|uniref:Uncharacterized protein n=1 Tax=Hebeloma cylindrosporum TaxID=76867 RepID=A0A0C3BS97_HEBCY|nr:hypothetical protein M413DRAFT_380244 [Hebeloma cylindrosporum h7]
MLPVVTLIRLFFAVVDAGSSNRLDQSKPLCVPTFYSPRVNDRGFSIHKSMAKNAFLVTAAVHLMLFILFAFVPRDGGISPEEIVWVGSVSLVALMSYIGALPFAPYIGGRVIVKLTRYRRLLEVLKLSVLMPAFIALYLTAKITILILSVIQLRALHQKTLVGIKWTSFFPHLG